MRRWRRRRALRRIAVLEYELGLWPPWELMLVDGYDNGWAYRLPTAHELDHPPYPYKTRRRAATVENALAVLTDRPGAVYCFQDPRG